MGVIISRFRRKKSTTEVLETLETEIKSIEKDGEAKERRRARVIGRVMAYSVGLYVALAAMYYWQFAKAQFGARTLIHASPLLVLPLIVIFIRSGISWYYNWALNKNRVKLSKMREEKKKILEEVMNTETYKTAKEILDKYGSPDEKALKPFVPTLNVPGNAPSTPVQATPGQLRQRQLALQNSTQLRNNSALAMSPAPNHYGRPRLSSSQLPRPLLDNTRSALDKVVDYLLKDGPNHRMALICAECSSHNGMAMVEEFEFVSYTCAYCGHRNPARKLRPDAPPLPQALPRRAYGSGDDSSMPSSGSDTDEEKKGPPNSNVASSGESDRPPSPEGTPVSNNKED